MVVTAGTRVLINVAQHKNPTILKIDGREERSMTTIVNTITDIHRFVFNPRRADSSSCLNLSALALRPCNKMFSKTIASKF